LLVRWPLLADCPYGVICQWSEPARHRRGSDGAPATLQEIFNLDDGPSHHRFPTQLTVESYQDLADHLELFLKAKRRAELEK
jgi:hypothetical protein